MPRGPSVCVVTATIGHRGLARALRSVRAQTHGGIEHLVVVDGPEFEGAVAPSLAEFAATDPDARPKVLVLPGRTGMNGWCSHRICAASAFLVETDFICFLDQDNWFDPEHVGALVEVARAHNAAAAFSLRAIHDQAGTLVCPDDCQSLGILHDSFDSPGQGHIDSNCWLLARKLAMRLAGHWSLPHTGDRMFARQVMALCPELPCSLLYSVHYTAGSRAQSATVEYFQRGNEAMRRRYPQGLPWRRSPAM